MLLGGTFTGIAALTLTHARQTAGTRGTDIVVGFLTIAYGVGRYLVRYWPRRCQADRTGLVRPFSLPRRRLPWEVC